MVSIVQKADAWFSVFVLGDIVYIQVLDTDIIVLSSSSIATQLLEKRSRIYSDRPFTETVIP